MPVFLPSARIRPTSRVWFIPAIYLIAAVILGRYLPEVNYRLAGDQSFFSPGTATSLLSAISSGMIAFTGFVFSMVFVIVQFGSSAYTPRLAGYLLQNRVVQHAIGLFTATFIYSLIALIWIDLRGTGAVADLSVAAAIFSVVLSTVLFLALITRITALQVTNVLSWVGRRGSQVIEEMYPHLYGDHAEAAAQPEYPSPLPPVTQEARYHGVPRTVLKIDHQWLIRLSVKADALIEINYPPGDTVPDGGAILEVRGASRSIPERHLLAAVELGDQRTIEQDPKYAFRLIVDIAIRALSPAVNDPTTAVQALDQIDNLLRRLGARRLRVSSRTDAEGVVRLIYPTPDWEDFLELATEEIRLYGANSIQVMRRLLALLTDLRGVVPEERVAAVDLQLRFLHGTIARAFPNFEDRHMALQADRQGIGLSRLEEDRGDQEESPEPLGDRE